MSDSGGEIQVLTGLEGVRRRPGMYVGDTDGDGLYHLIWEVVGNVIDLHLARAATELRVEVTADSWVTVRDDGPGIPVDTRPQDHKTVLETVFTVVHAGATYDGHFPHVHLTPSLRGVGLAVVNALSTRLEVETTRSGVRWAQAYERGIPCTEVRNRGPSSVEGTSVRFQPDPEIFRTVAFDLDRVKDRLQHLAWLNPLLRVFFQGQRLSGRGGLRTWVENIVARRGKVSALYSTNQSSDGGFVDVALGWSESPETTIYSFVNMEETLTGTHVDGLWRGISEFAAGVGATVHGSEKVRKTLGPGLVAVLHVGLYAPRFGGPKRDHLESPTAGTAVRHVLERDLPTALWHDIRLRTYLQDKLGFTWTPKPPS